MYQPPTASVPAAWLGHITNVAARFNVSTEQLLEGQAIAAHELEAPNNRVPLDTLIAVIERSRKLTHEPAIGVHLGLQTRATLFGHLGFATLSAPTMRGAIQVAVRFIDLLTPAIGLRLIEDRDVAELILDEHEDFGSARDAVIFWLLLGIWSVGGIMTGAKSAVCLELAMTEPEYMSQVSSGLPPIHFRQEVHRILIPTSRMDLPYLMHDPSAHRTALELCERQRETMMLHGPTVRSVRELLRRSKTPPAFSNVAEELRLSQRTLSRRLADESSSFRDLIEEERRRRGIALVTRDGVSFAHIAARLGYSNVSNFERAFRRWTGQSPAQYRRAKSATASGSRQADQRRKPLRWP